MKGQPSLLAAGLLLAWPFAPASGQSEPRPATITVKADQPGVKVSPSLWGIFYEEINHAGPSSLEDRGRAGPRPARHGSGGGAEAA
jgi:hypothetical protein